MVALCYSEAGHFSWCLQVYMWRNACAHSLQLGCPVRRVCLPVHGHAQRVPFFALRSRGERHYHPTCGRSPCQPPDSCPYRRAISSKEVLRTRTPVQHLHKLFLVAQFLIAFERTGTSSGLELPASLLRQILTVWVLHKLLWSVFWWLKVEQRIVAQQS